MEAITIGQIASAIGIISVIAGFCIAIFKWYKANITNKFKNIDEKFDEVNNRLECVEKHVAIKEQEFLQEMSNSKKERSILMRGELACLKGLYATTKSELMTNSIKEIEDYMMERSHN